MGTGYFLGVKRPGRGLDHSPPSSAEVKERVELYLYSLSGPPWRVRVLYYGQGVPEFLSYRTGCLGAMVCGQNTRIVVICDGDGVSCILNIV